MDHYSVGAHSLADLGAVRDQEPLFGEVASDSTAFRLIDRIASDPALLAALRAARAQARENTWAAGAKPEWVIIEIDATLIGAHSEKEGAAGTFIRQAILSFALNQVWLEISMIAQDLIVWTQALALAHALTNAFARLAALTSRLTRGVRSRRPRRKPIQQAP